MCFKLYFCFHGDQLSVCSDICIRDVEGEWLLSVSKTESFGWIHCFSIIVFVVILSVLVSQPFCHNTLKCLDIVSVISMYSFVVVNCCLIIHQVV